MQTVMEKDIFLKAQNMSVMRKVSSSILPLQFQQYYCWLLFIIHYIYKTKVSIAYINTISRLDSLSLSVASKRTVYTNELFEL